MVKDPGRTASHNAFITSLNMFSRFQKKNGLKTVWREKLGDKKDYRKKSVILHALLLTSMESMQDEQHELDLINMKTTFLEVTVVHHTNIAVNKEAL